MTTLGEVLVVQLVLRGVEWCSKFQACTRPSYIGGSHPQVSAMSHHGMNKVRGSWPMVMHGFGENPGWLLS